MFLLVFKDSKKKTYFSFLLLLPPPPLLTSVLIVCWSLLNSCPPTTQTPIWLGDFSRNKHGREQTPRVPCGAPDPFRAITFEGDMTNKTVSHRDKESNSFCPLPAAEIVSKHLLRISEMHFLSEYKPGHLDENPGPGRRAPGGWARGFCEDQW